MTPTYGSGVTLYAELTSDKKGVRCGAVSCGERLGDVIPRRETKAGELPRPGPDAPALTWHLRLLDYYVRDEEGNWYWRPVREEYKDRGKPQTAEALFDRIAHTVELSSNKYRLRGRGKSYREDPRPRVQITCKNKHEQWLMYDRTIGLLK